MGIFDHIDQRTRTSHKRRWDSLRGQGNLLDMERARFLHDVLVTNLNKDPESLAEYMATELDEYKGKRTSMFVRMTLAYGQDKKREHWTALGGIGMVLLVRIADRRKRTRVLRGIQAVLRNTGRDSVSNATLRSVLRSVLGPKTYRTVILERRGHPLMTYREQCVIFQRDLLKLARVPGNLAMFSQDTKTLLRLTRGRRSEAA